MPDLFRITLIRDHVERYADIGFTYAMRLPPAVKDADGELYVQMTNAYGDSTIYLHVPTVTSRSERDA